jgi:hypothetical protein
MDVPLSNVPLSKDHLHQTAGIPNRTSKGFS